MDHEAELGNGRFYLGTARLFMPPLEQARGAAAILLVEGFQKGRTRNPDLEACATRSFRRFFRTVEFCFWSVWARLSLLELAGGMLGSIRKSANGNTALLDFIKDRRLWPGQSRAR
ncbi:MULTISPECIES: hypothetical protein [unclassified Mesorhizobium]|uniref:hypothetical protein n=1 Tax=unclassified Mesorhizobium TaxID=325217 RepID=UPI003337E20B